MSSMGSPYNLRYLGSTPISKFTTGFSVLQKPLHGIYVSYLTPKGLRQPVASRLALTDRGIILTIQGNDSFYSMRDVLLWEAVHWVRVQTKDKKFMAAFEPIDPDRHRGKDGLYSKLDSQYKYLTKLNHEPLLALVLRRTSGPKTIDVHAFVCNSEAQVSNIVASITRMQEQFQSQEAQRTGVFEYTPFQEPPGSVRVPSGNPAVHLANPNGFRSQRQVKPNEREGEITLEELVRLADMALADPVKSNAAAKEAPPFRMGESWAKNENHHGVRRARTFNEGQKRNAESRVTGQDRHQSNVQLEPQVPSEAPRGGVGGAEGGGGGGGGAVAWKELQDARYYENVSAPNGQQRTYENLNAPGSIPTNNYGLRRSPVPHPRLHQQQVPPTHGSLDDRDAARMNGQQPQQLADPLRRKSTPPESLRMVIAESKMANKRVSVLPGNDFCISNSAFNLPTAGDSRAPAFVEVYSDHDQQPLQPNPSPKPVAMVQPRKVSGVRVLPEPVLEGFQLHKVSNQPGKGLDEPKKEQYQRGEGGNRNFTRSMFELNNAVSKPTTPQAPVKFTNPDPDPVRKFTSADPDPVRKFTSADPDPVRKFTSADPDPVRKFTSADPDPVRKFTSADPDPVRKFTSADPDPVRKFTSADPDPVRKFTSADPDPVRKFTSADPDPVRKFTSADPDPVRKFTSADPDPVRKFTSAEPEPARKSSIPEAVNRDGRENKATEKPSGERGKKDAEIEAFAMNINFYRPPTNTLSPHGTNFESALGYFP